MSHCARTFIAYLPTEAGNTVMIRGWVSRTGHVYRAEPHATSRHLTEYYSLDLEMGFIDGPEDVIELERRLLAFIFERLNEAHSATLSRYRKAPLPSMRKVPVWEFGECLERLGREDLVDDLDPEAERALCRLGRRNVVWRLSSFLDFRCPRAPSTPIRVSRLSAEAARPRDSIYCSTAWRLLPAANVSIDAAS
jgi:hypothetical protein